jgi:hypothetical protein
MSDEKTEPEYKPLFLTEFPTTMQKCPLHRCYIQKLATKRNTVRIRYCPRCDAIRLQLEAKAKAEAPASPTQPAPKVRIMTL